MTRLGGDTLKRYDHRRFDWDVALGRTWVRVLVFAYFLPIAVPLFAETLWIWPWTGMGEADLVYVLLGTLPLLLAVAAWLVLAIPTRRTRGGLLFAFCVGSVLAPAEGVLRTGAGNLQVLDAVSAAGWLAALLLTGCVLLAAGNRQQKRTLGRGVAPILAGLGGLAIVFVFLFPYFPPAPDGSRGDTPLAALFLLPEAWEEGWPLLLWLLGLFAFGVLGTCSLFAIRLGDGFAEGVQNGISRLARLLPLLLPVIALIAFVLSGLPGFGYFLLFVAKAILGAYSVVFLASIGLARVLDDADPDTVWLQEEQGDMPEDEALDDDAPDDDALDDDEPEVEPQPR